MSYGPNPWQQAHWDWRAAGNFICGGAGAGLVIFTVLSGLQGLAAPLAILAGLGLVGLGLLCVWLEIGRPLRALHVYFNPRTSWMSREAFVAALLLPATLGAAAGLAGCDWLAGALALAFGDIDDPQSNVSQLLAGNQHFRMHDELGTGPGFFYLWDRNPT